MWMNLIKQESQENKETNRDNPTREGRNMIRNPTNHQLTKPLHFVPRFKARDLGSNRPAPMRERLGGRVECVFLAVFLAVSNVGVAQPWGW
jgi:hypothetical protein